MASIYQLKPKFQSLLRPLVIRLALSGISANMVTVAAMVLSSGCGLLLLLVSANAILLLVPAVLLIRMALNAIDGMLAREHGQASRLGAVLNELGDVISDAALYLPLTLHLAAPPWMMVLIVLASVIVEMTGVIGAQIGASRRYDGPLGKSDRAAVFGILSLLVGAGMQQRPWMAPLLGLLLLLSLVTIINRARGALAEEPHRA